VDGRVLEKEAGGNQGASGNKSEQGKQCGYNSLRKTSQVDPKEGEPRKKNITMGGIYYGKPRNKASAFRVEDSTYSCIPSPVRCSLT